MRGRICDAVPLQLPEVLLGFWPPAWSTPSLSLSHKDVTSRRKTIVDAELAATAL